MERKQNRSRPNRYCLNCGKASEMVANWYMGDGYFDPSTGRSALSTHSFSLEDLDFIRRKMKRTLGVTAKIYPDRCQDNQPILKMSRRDSKLFLNYIDEWRVGCFEYKWGL